MGSLKECLWCLEDSVSLLADCNRTLSRNNDDHRFITQKLLQCDREHMLATEFDMERATKDLNEDVQPLMRLKDMLVQRSLPRLKDDLHELEKVKRENEVTLLEMESSAVYQNESTLTSGDVNTNPGDVVVGPISQERLQQLKNLNLEIEQKRQQLAALQEAQESV
ncbi:Spc19p KNAG_0A04600 [Huiozyma naganishii CBS 8797]|uniref:Uncharacterized protein n=1 Tax=Huiozyma naganishii (strain ATCC MYA-139 / BCRC 22969 / CBS 8797 / KCTC 17520 / NBRC 10181 / NCYC 3082 / Yp74L-3) TaxID=1071383 RepID=J7RTQ0_HUIN7|nr:hypothetical protein KNAG_0A04600 [Kazachstania naganishii CBS 8797]CCK68132.1 hypothetical protein KNAG_0A04600 [Kazachstania naganishii CBS 8797]